MYDRSPALIVPPSFVIYIAIVIHFYTQLLVNPEITVRVVTTCPTADLKSNMKYEINKILCVLFTSKRAVQLKQVKAEVANLPIRILLNAKTRSNE